MYVINFRLNFRCVLHAYMVFCLYISERDKKNIIINKKNSAVSECKRCQNFSPSRQRMWDCISNMNAIFFFNHIFFLCKSLFHNVHSSIIIYASNFFFMLKLQILYYMRAFTQLGVFFLYESSHFFFSWIVLQKLNVLVGGMVRNRGNFALQCVPLKYWFLFFT